MFNFILTDTVDGRAYLVNCSRELIPVAPSGVRWLDVDTHVPDVGFMAIDVGQVKLDINLCQVSREGIIE